MRIIVDMNAPIVVENLSSCRPALRVAVVTETWPPEVNGVAMTISRLCEGLIRRQHVVQLIRPRQEVDSLAGGQGEFEEVLARGLPIPKYEGLRFGLPARGELFRLWSHRRPDIVHIVTEGPLGWSALSVARRLKLPVSASFHTNFDVYSRHYGVGWLQGPVDALLRKFHNRADLTFVPTAALLGELAARGFQKLDVLARGVDTAMFGPQRRSAALRAQWGLAAGDVAVICVGRVAAEKNLPLAIRAFEHIAAEQPRAKMIIVGDGPFRAELEKRHPQVIFAGVRIGVELAEHYASADLFLFPSLTETYGNVTLEAMASGLAVVAYAHAAAAELIADGRDGLLADAGDEAGFVACASALAGDANLRRVLGAAARERVAAIDWERIQDAFGERLGELVRRHDRLRKADFALLPI